MLLYTRKYHGKGPGDEGHCSVPGVNPISRKRDESVPVMSFPNGTTDPPENEISGNFIHALALIG